MRLTTVFTAAALSLGLAAGPALAHPPARHAAAIAPAAKPIAVQVSTIKLPGSGAPLYALRDNRLPRVWWHLYLESGERSVPARLSGLAEVAADVLNEGPAGMSLAAYRQLLFRQGAAIQWEAGNRFLVVNVKCAPAQVAAMAALLRRTIREPRLGGGAFARARDRVLTNRRAMDDDMRQATFHYGKAKLWEFAPGARQPDGWPAGIAAITEADLAGWLKGPVGAPAAFLAAAGPVAPQQLAKTVAGPLAGWIKPFKGGKSPMPALPAGRRVVLIDKPGATDNQIYMLTPIAVDLTQPEAYAAEVFFAGMGRDLGARLGNTLRVQRGLTYGANSGLRAVEWPSWYVYTFGGIEQTPKLLAGIFELFDAAKTGLTGKEVALAKDQLMQDKAGDLETPPEQIQAVASAVALGLPPGHAFRAPVGLAGVTTAGAARPAREVAGLDRTLIVVMGDAKKLKGPIEAVLPAGTTVEVKTFQETEREALGARP